MRGAEPVSEAARLDRQAIDAILWYGIAWLEDLIRLGLSGETSVLHNPDLEPSISLSDEEWTGAGLVPI